MGPRGDDSGGAACPVCGEKRSLDESLPCALCQDAEDRAHIQKALLPHLGTRYELVSRLGAGAFGEVYRARDTMLDREVAIKRVRLDTFEADQRDEVRARTVREAKTAAKLKHPNIVTIHDIADTPAMSFIIMEFVDGPTLEHVLKAKRRLKMDEVLSVIGATADALDFAHEHGVVHRDVKPANIMLEGENSVKVMDFGIAKSDGSTSLTSVGSILGSPHYMSPEQARGESAVDGRSDLFSLGCVLYECITGEKAFKGKTLMGTLMAIITKEPAPVDYERRGFHPDMGKIVARAIAKSPADRYETAGELVEAIRALPIVEPPETLEDSGVRQQPVVTRREPGTTSSFDISLQGKLTSATVAEVIREVYAARHTGILHVSRDGIDKRIYFRKGNLVFANSDVDTDKLGEFLIQSGEIERSAFETATLAMKDTGQRLGQTLVALNSLSPRGLEDAVRRQVEAIVYSVIEWEQGAFGFEALDRPVEEDIVLDLSTADLVLAGVRRIQSAERIDEVVGGHDRVMVMSSNPVLLYQAMDLTTSEGFVLSRVDGIATVDDIVAISPLPRDETMRCIYALVATGVVALESKDDARQLAQERAASGVVIPRPDVSVVEDDSEEFGDQALVDDVADKHAALESASLYDVLEVEPDVSPAFLEQVHYTLAKRYHPDRHHHPALRPVHGLLEELFGAITEAFQTLSDARLRELYDAELEAAGGVDDDGEIVVELDAELIPPEITARRQYQQGREHYDQMEFIDAVRCLRESVRLEPDNPTYRKLLAAALSKNPRFREEAVEHLNKVLEVDDHDAAAQLALAAIYEDSQLPDAAKPIYEKVLSFDTQNTLAHARLTALSTLAMRETEEMRTALNDATSS